LLINFLTDSTDALFIQSQREGCDRKGVGVEKPHRGIPLGFKFEIGSGLFDDRAEDSSGSERVEWQKLI
jgi:hypothetical protein